jgi:hypothetical protein
VRRLRFECECQLAHATRTRAAASRREPLACLLAECASGSLFTRIDPCIEALALNGALMMARFLEGRDCGLAISWDMSHSGTGVVQEMMPASFRRGLAALSKWTWREVMLLTAGIALVLRLRQSSRAIRIGPLLTATLALYALRRRAQVNLLSTNESVANLEGLL